MARRLLSGQGVIEVVAKSRGEGRRLLSPSGEHPEASGTLGTPVFKRQRRGVHPGERTGAEELGHFLPRRGANYTVPSTKYSAPPAHTHTHTTPPASAA